MEIYFVRHGETDFNRDHKHQPNDLPLNETGRQQALAVAEEIKQLQPTQLFSSDMARAQETAAAIAQATGLSSQSLATAAELYRPEALIGHGHYTWRSLIFIWRWFFSKDEAYWQRVRGESRPAFLKRIIATKNHLEELPADARVVVVVSHSVFINFFVAHICNETPLSIWKTILLLLKLKRLDNSSITHLSYHPAAPNTCAWTLVKFDDDDHVVT